MAPGVCAAPAPCRLFPARESDGVFPDAQGRLSGRQQGRRPRPPRPLEEHE